MLLAGGLCDPPSLRNERSPHVPYNRVSLWDGSTGKWGKGAALTTSRIFHSATLLRDGSVLIVGGESDPLEVPEGEPVLNTVERYRDGGIEPAPPLREGRGRHTATLLADGSLLVVGGFDANGKAMASVELWDPVAGRWQEATPLNHGRYGHSAILLDDGRVMVAGGVGARGQAIGSVEIRDPVTGTWSAGKPLLLPLYDHAAIRLKDGDVLVSGGRTLRAKPVRDTMLWDKGVAEWKPAGTLALGGPENSPVNVVLLALPDGGARLFGPSWIVGWSRSGGGPASYPAYGERQRNATTPIADGRVLLSGGLSGDVFLDWAEVFDPRTGRFALTGRLNQPRHSHSAAALDDGSVVIAGGWARSTDDPATPLANSPEVWDPRTGNWKLIEAIRFEWQDWVHLARLNDGTVLFFASRELGEKPDGPVEYRTWKWNPLSGQADSISVPLKPRSRAGIAIKPDGTIVVAGGNTRVFEPEYRCPPRAAAHSPPRAAADNDEQGDEEGDECQDEPAHWEEHPDSIVEVWDTRSGAVTRADALPDRFMADPRTLVLTNGDIVLADYQPANPYAGVRRVGVLRLSAATRKWSNLPAIESDESRSLLELADGSLMARTLRLPPDAKAWASSRRVQSDDAVPVRLPSGKLIALATRPPHVAEYDPDAASWRNVLTSDVAPVWRTRPALAPLTDGRLMVVATVESGPESVQTAYLWDPERDAWSAAGRLARRYGSGQAVALPGGRVLHLGTFSSNETVCEFWRPEDNTWTFCGTLSHDGKSVNPLLGRLADGSPAVLSGANEALVYRDSENAWVRMRLELNSEGLAYGAPIRPAQGFYARVFDAASGRSIDASALAAADWQAAGADQALWDEGKQEWAYVLPRGRGLGPHAHFLPDGCALSLRPLRIFDPRTGLVTPVADPGLGPEYSDATMAVMADGTVVVAGALYGASAGTGFFHRKATCAGFAAGAEDAGLMPAAYVTQDVVARPAAAAVEVPQTLQQRARRFGFEYRWILLAMLAPLLAYLVLRRLQPVGAGILQRLRGRDADTAAAGRAWSTPFRWTMRGILYLVAAAVFVPMLVHYLAFRRDLSASQCAKAPAECADESTGVVHGILARIRGAADSRSQPRIPCRYVGQWSSVRPGKVYRITLHDDGRYMMAPNAGGGDRGFSGKWAVEGTNMVWRHDQFPGAGRDINAIVQESDSRFTLIERDGTQTKFELIEAAKSAKCVP